MTDNNSNVNRMMALLNADNSSESLPSQTNEKNNESDQSGTLVITACIDWENATSKKAYGLDVPHTIDLGHPVSKVFSSSTSFHLFILLADRKSIYGVGRNDHGQLGVGTKVTHHWPTPIRDLSNSIISSIATGKSHSLILYENHDLYVCGANNFGQLGLGEGTRASADVLFPQCLNLSNISAVACGADYSLVCTTEGNLYSFGHPEYGQLGHGTTGEFIKDGGKGPAVQYRYVSKPQRVTRFFRKDPVLKRTNVELPSNDIKIVGVAAGKNHSLCIESSEDGSLNRVFSWGFGGYGRLGHNGTDDELYPVEIATFSQQRNLAMKQV